MPLPPTRHACSTCLPSWQTILDYEEGRDKVMRALKSGYPRFVLHPDVKALHSRAKKAFASDSQEVLVFPHREGAQRAQRMLELEDSVALEIKSYHGVFVLLFPEALMGKAKSYWRYTGEGVSSRQAARIVAKDDTGPAAGSARSELADFFEIKQSCLHLWPSGMNAIFSAHRFAQKVRGGLKSLQIEFPYVDAMRVQQKFGAGVVFLSEASGEDFNAALERIVNQEFSAVFVEVPSNPLLKTAAIAEISQACQTGRTPLIIDDTVASHYNVEVLSYADVVTTSLTKWVSGKGNVMGGATRINPASAFAGELEQFFDEQTRSGSLMYSEDEAVLLENTAGFAQRMQQVNRSASELAAFFADHPAVESVYYPELTDKEAYDCYKTPHGGYGGLISLVLKNKKKSIEFYDGLKLSKGPSLGTEFTLVCPYTMLAHYDELDWAEDHGVSRYLIRVSIGLEPVNHLLAIFSEALEGAE